MVGFHCRIFPLGSNTFTNERENEIRLQLYQTYKQGRIYCCGPFDYIFQFQPWVCGYLYESGRRQSVGYLHRAPAVVRRTISANPGLNFNLGFPFFCSKALSRIIFSILFRVSNHQIGVKKMIKLTLLFKLPYLNLNVALTPGSGPAATKNTDSASGIWIEHTVSCNCTFAMLLYHGDVSGEIFLNFKSVV